MSQTETRNHRIKCDYGMPDYYRFYKDTSKSPKSNKVFSDVVRDYLDANRTAVYSKAYIYVLPQRLGRIEIRKMKREVIIDKEGKVINKLLINWKETKKLWSENKEAKERKIKIRYTNEHTDGYVFRPIYMKNTANFKNKSIYKLKVNRDMARKTEPAIVSKKIDAFLL